MSFNKISTLVWTSDNDDYSPNAADLPTPTVTTTETFLARRDNQAFPGPDVGSGAPLGVPTGATRVMVHNHGTQRAGVGFSTTSMFEIDPGCTTQWQVPTGFDPTTYRGYSTSGSVNAMLLFLAWQ